MCMHARKTCCSRRPIKSRVAGASDGGMVYEPVTTRARVPCTARSPAQVLECWFTTVVGRERVCVGVVDGVKEKERKRGNWT